MEKRRFLYYNLHRLCNNKRSLLYNYIEENEINHSENSNGLLLNLSQLDDKHIDFCYELYNLENKIPTYDLIEIKAVHINTPKITTISYKDYQLTTLDKLILSYSYN